MGEKVIPYKNSKQRKKEQVTGMFDTISPTYDELNRVMTMRLDINWRKNVRKEIAKINPLKILDVATGTGDLAIELTQIDLAHITGLDLSQGMLDIGKKKIEKQGLSHRINLTLGDSEALPFADNWFDAVSVSFGVRNFENLEKGLYEIYRVLCNGGRLVVLETSVPEHFPVKQGYYLYTHFIVPFMGKLLAKDKTAYAYLSESASKFPFGQRFADILTKIGFSKVHFKPQTLGVATIYIADK
ncbi:bifunctional demethylmenaquinone methyltransferase/2-methoxy-6-polyprenyl-1,4-benzoquinol methylase UbiE [Capnocytophaga catalasegens]|uniref:Demethylmenaquinone methyltransferase n=1 Tax=Capnocytophaga catalasegens TaxID=1004260 RepID=A0AAV5AVL1_9FLAO|nr:bifunctional demethylmenaquinone methyltransferase/2-methoxy-6-polyprenyl-1,4-benzoquinol methylase UbiE [Capnocytophaga catalasegens]GIZ16265.1 demethylmenaquinone methyltransferase [Capnocytophaga catalasegens]GJM49472.1 demethylmenaquinone methyltransferase [Capnocytophaga catalasegens]GJM52863.1 demethylmenaquinone methyltransferase [Capnocytophaga catalasegens]